MWCGVMCFLFIFIYEFFSTLNMFDTMLKVTASQYYGVLSE